MNWAIKIISKTLMTKISHISWRGYYKGFYSRTIDLFREKYGVTEQDFYPPPELPIKKVEEKMLKIFKERKRAHALNKLQGITKLIQAKRIFKFNKKKVRF